MLQMVRFERKFVNGLQLKRFHLGQFTGLRSADLRESELTAYENESIDNLPYHYDILVRKRKPTTRKEIYLYEKLPTVKALFGEDPQYPGFISHSLPSVMPIPFKASRDFEKNSITNRLSVTTLLTKSWCELRHAYDIYSNIPIFEGRPIIKGKKEHRKLEDETHPLIEGQKSFEKDFEVEIPDDDFHKFAESWFESLIKLVNLFTNGEAREILCHGYLNQRSCRLVEEDGAIGDDDILVSGVIDHLILKLRDSPDLRPVRLGNSIVTKDSRDIASLLDQLEEASPYLQEKFEIMVSDVKTRSRHRIPSQESVLRSSKLQVMYYRFFMEILVKNPEETYKKLLINAQRRGFDVDRFVDPAKVLSMMATDDILKMDMYRLKKGDNIGFKPFDDSELAISKDCVYDMSSYKDMIKDSKIIEIYGDFFGLWAKPVTLRYFAARLAEIYRRLGSLLSNKLMIEYYYNGRDFHNIVFDFDLETLNKESIDGAKFWFGRRDIEPIEPTLRNFLTFCKSCDYEAVCSWKKAGKDRCKELGDDLIKSHMNMKMHCIKKEHP